MNQGKVVSLVTLAWLALGRTQLQDYPQGSKEPFNSLGDIHTYSLSVTQLGEIITHIHPHELPEKELSQQDGGMKGGREGGKDPNETWKKTMRAKTRVRREAAKKKSVKLWTDEASERLRDCYQTRLQTTMREAGGGGSG
ncbi:hypothetical protein Q8A73_017216 [Channa argus]|nr:hypothetical protein Q8A73_017216 [Channa argus]